MAAPTAIVFLGGIGGSPAADMVAGCHRAITRDTIERIQHSSAFQQIILVTEHGDDMPPVTIEPSGHPFHFGSRLKEVIDKYDIESPCYIGGGSVPLMSSGGLGAIGEQIVSATNTVIANNFYSSDLVAFTPGQAIAAIEPPAADNTLAQLLANRAGLSLIELPRTAATLFDVDTPTDLSILKIHAGAGSHTKAYLEGLDIDTSRLERAVRLLGDGDAQVTVAGRVGSYVWSRLERETSCRVRMLAEERSMNADRRARRGEVCSILGFYLEQVGMERFFATMGQLGHAAIIDSRVIFTHFGLTPTVDDRFNSDLGEYERIGDPFIREFTRQALEAPIPIVLGGHSLVSGGLLALIEVSQSKRPPSG
jgi:hypothetical protein